MGKENGMSLLFCLSVSVSLRKQTVLTLCCLFKVAWLPLNPPLIPAQSIPSTVMLPGLKACLVKCSTSEMVCVHVSLAYQKS